MDKIDKKSNGGRPAGVPNRNSLTVRMSLNKMGFDAVTELVKAIQEIEDPSVRADHIQKLMQYMYPKLKEIEVTPTQILEMEQQDIMELKPADIPTERLLEQIKDK
jgi:hypothetical protein